MISYIVLTPPGGPDRDHRSTLFIADKIAWWALLLPWIWLLAHRMWLAGAMVFVSEVAAGLLMQQSGLGLAGWLASLAIHVLVAIEGRNLYIRHLVRKGWSVAGLVTAPELSTAEEMFFASLPEPIATPLPALSDWAKPNSSKIPGWDAPALGLFDHTGAR